MTRDTRRKIERDVEGLQETEGQDGVRLVRETEDGWVDARTGDPVEVDEEELETVVADFSETST